jgi:hypothetical protein
VFPPFLTLLLVRIGLGERLEKAKSEDYRAWFGFLFLFPCALGLGVYFGHQCPFNSPPLAPAGAVVDVWFRYL